jgi:hypothetical protein
MTMTTTTTTTMTKNQNSRPVAGWTKQVASFATSFAFFGLAGFLQSQAVATVESTAAAEQPIVAAETVVATAQVAQIAQPELLGPVQPITEASLQATEPAPTVEVAPAPVVATPAPVQAEPVAVDTHTAAS